MRLPWYVQYCQKCLLIKVRAAEELLAVTRKLKQLWILSESKDVDGARKAGLEKPLEVGDVAKQLQRIIQEGFTDEKNGVQQENDEELDKIQFD